MTAYLTPAPITVPAQHSRSRAGLWLGLTGMAGTVLPWLVGAYVAYSAIDYARTSIDGAYGLDTAGVGAFVMMLFLVPLALMLALPSFLLGGFAIRYKAPALGISTVVMAVLPAVVIVVSVLLILSRDSLDPVL